ncbi:hypothetical protein PHMEG_00035116 [Phytophthora megakarya]|uniref:ZSWIM1/3 RNaseH-like domain-containing protein n=1 Tax=Phytophthora megakarya TaxID=4795 RepID=A0A225UPF9_9STRA|nr:hypothetical protein PHMEG_00035116 [Phytophthora megakarya]
MIQEVRNTFRAGRTDVERAIAVLDEFMEEWNLQEMLLKCEWLHFSQQDRNAFFDAFPEVVLVDATHDTNVNRYKLFSFAVHDVFGRTEENANLALAVAVFNRNNPAWSKIRVVMTDKALHEKETAIMSLARGDLAKKQCSRLGDVDRTAT